MYKSRKLFKILTIADYLLLNGATALVDFFNDEICIFE
jgi:hypothetical protein